MYIKIAFNNNKSRAMYLFLLLLFMFQLFIVKQRYTSASLQVPEKSEIHTVRLATYIMLENTNVVTNTVLKEHYVK